MATVVNYGEGDMVDLMYSLLAWWYPVANESALPIVYGMIGSTVIGSNVGFYFGYDEDDLGPAIGLSCAFGAIGWAIGVVLPWAIFLLIGMSPTLAWSGGKLIKKRLETRRVKRQKLIAAEERRIETEYQQTQQFMEQL